MSAQKKDNVLKCVTKDYRENNIKEEAFKNWSSHHVKTTFLITGFDRLLLVSFKSFLDHKMQH